MKKNALLERLVRLAATDVPSTPRLLMRHRTPQELASLQGTVGSLGGLKPKIEGALHSATDKVFTDRFAQPVKKMISTGVQHPDMALLQAAPLVNKALALPGMTEGYMAGKKGLEKLIDRVAPLPKIAGADSAEHSSEKKKALLGAGGAVGSLAGSTAAGLHVMRRIDRTPRPESLPRDSLFHKVRAAAPVDVTHQPILGGGITASGEAAPMYNLETNQVHFPSSSSHAGALAHEFGHADIAKSRMGRLLQNKATLMAGMASPAIGITSGAFTADSDNPTVRRLGIAAPALAALPMLGYEGLASLKGVSRLRNAGAAGKELWHASKDLLPAWGSYLGRAGMGVGSAMMAQHGMRASNLQSPVQKRKQAVSEEWVKNIVGTAKAPLDRLEHFAKTMNNLDSQRWMKKWQRAAHAERLHEDRLAAGVIRPSTQDLGKGGGWIKGVRDTKKEEVRKAKYVAGEGVARGRMASGDWDKQAAGAPTRGNFYMSSDIPSFAAPDLTKVVQKRSEFDGKNQPNEGEQKMAGGYNRLSGLDEPNQPAQKMSAFKLEGDAVIEVDKKGKSLGKGNVLEKDSDMLPDYVTYSQGDFKKSKYSMSIEGMATFVAQLRKVAAGAHMGVSPTLGGAASAAKSVGAPKLDTPSIAAQVKPKGPGFGSGTAGAFNSSVMTGGIGGRTRQAL